MAKRIVYLDLLRVMACAAIVLMHSPAPDAGVPGVVQVPLGFITSVGLVLFFVVSGALLLPVKTDTFSFLGKRMGKVVVPLLFWTLFYLGVSLALGEKSWGETIHSVMSIPFTKQGHGILWFLYVLIGLYLLSPIISPMLQKRQKKSFNFICFYGV